MDVRLIETQGATLPGEPDRVRPLLELFTVVGLLESELWFLRARGPAWLNVLIYGVIVTTLWLSYDRRRKVAADFEGATSGPIRSWLEVLVVSSVLSAVLVGVAFIVGDSSERFEFVFLDKPPAKMAQWVAGKFLAALGQQLALQWFLWPVCFEITRSRLVGTLTAASIFGLIHLPSWMLVAITFVAGTTWITLYQRTGRLAPLVFSHMILATLAHGGLPERLTYDMRVGQAATADLKRFSELSDPKYRLAIRRLKENRAELKMYTSRSYFESQGSTLPGFIRGLYRDILARPAAETDVDFWINRKLPNPLVDIPSMFLSSDEYAQIQQAKKSTGGEPRLRR